MLKISKIKKTVMVIIFISMIGLLPIINAESVPGVSVNPGESYIWKINKTFTDENDETETEILYRLINVTSVTTKVETTEIEYNDFTTNATEYEGIVLHKVDWTDSNLDLKLLLNNTDPKNNFGGFVNLETADLTTLEDLNEKEQMDFFLDFLMVASTEFFYYVVLIVFTTAFSFGEVTSVNSSQINSVSKNQIDGTLNFGYSIFFDTSNTWHNISLATDYNLIYDSSAKILTSSTIDIDFIDKTYNDTTDVYSTKTETSITQTELIYPEKLGGLDILGLVEPIIDKIVNFTGLPVTTLGLIAGGALVLLIVICICAKKKKK